MALFTAHLVVSRGLLKTSELHADDQLDAAVTWLPISATTEDGEKLGSCGNIEPVNLQVAWTAQSPKPEHHVDSRPIGKRGEAVAIAMEDFIHFSGKPQNATTTGPIATLKFMEGQPLGEGKEVSGDCREVCQFANGDKWFLLPAIFEAHDANGLVVMDPHTGQILEERPGLAKLALGKAYGFKNSENVEIALYHQLGDLSEPKVTHESC